MSVPLLLVDVDGVISLFGFDSGVAPAGRWAMVEGIAHLISATAGDQLHELAQSFELVWCSGWEEKASQYLPSLLGLEGEIEHLSFERNPSRGGSHWKLAAIDAHAGAQRPLAWVDDAHEKRTRAWAAARPGPTLLVQTEPAVGLTEPQVTQLRRWAAALAEDPSEGPARSCT